MSVDTYSPRQTSDIVIRSQMNGLTGNVGLLDVNMEQIEKEREQRYICDKQNAALVEHRKQLKDRQKDNTLQEEYNHLHNIEKFNVNRDKDFKTKKEVYAENLEQQYLDSFQKRDDHMGKIQREKNREKEGVIRLTDELMKQEYQRLQEKLVKHEQNQKYLDNQIATKLDYDREIIEKERCDAVKTGINIGTYSSPKRDYKGQLDNQNKVKNEIQKQHVEEIQAEPKHIGYQTYKAGFDKKYQKTSSSPRKKSDFTSNQTLVDKRPLNLASQDAREQMEQKQLIKTQQKQAEKECDAMLMREQEDHAKRYTEYEKECKKVLSDELKRDLQDQMAQRNPQKAK